ncbi:MAG: hypothetical protein RLZZ436_3438, partial [Planctomycetota bacterium]
MDVGEKRAPDTLPHDPIAAACCGVALASATPLSGRAEAPGYASAPWC